ncbi:MAG: FadR family transcriptional regulator [Alphaproteobacteria bacterium]|nr:FadR family transcriptional regulator [Alphaproteobacteria bacterium]
MRQNLVMRQLQELVAQLDPGERLPAERRLARQIGCSRETLRAALADLQRAGRIWRHVGQGTFCGPAPRELLVRETLLIDNATPTDLLRARLALEPRIAAEAAREAEYADIVALERLVAQGCAAADRSECEQVDSSFHRAIAHVTRNPVLIGLMTYLSNARRHALWQRKWERSYRLLPASEFQTVHSNQHRQIVSAIARGQPDEAEAAMTMHLKVIEGAFSRTAGC